MSSTDVHWQDGVDRSQQVRLVCAYEDGRKPELSTRNDIVLRIADHDRGFEVDIGPAFLCLQEQPCIWLAA